mmetsp:Transcript_69481/g.196897  ORF Transcript_69481/g.196897 Transcript_69481/m.196897 type:complete len:212 (+) Transcript_69481:405-1040(+)
MWLQPESLYTACRQLGHSCIRSSRTRASNRSSASPFSRSQRLWPSQVTPGSCSCPHWPHHSCPQTAQRQCGSPSSQMPMPWQSALGQGLALWSASRQASTERLRNSPCSSGVRQVKTTDCSNASTQAPRPRPPPRDPRGRRARCSRRRRRTPRCGARRSPRSRPRSASCTRSSRTWRPWSLTRAQSSTGSTTTPRSPSGSRTPPGASFRRR